jgi:hypothetical protein
MKDSIPFTQYLMPNGERRSIEIKRPEDIYEKAMDIIKAGHCFEAEMLRTGEISLTIFNVAEEEDVDIEVIANGPEVPLAVDRMVTRFYNALAGEGVERDG